jgi:hypothetical protein
MANPRRPLSRRLARKCAKVGTRAAESLLSGSNGTCVTC